MIKISLKYKKYQFICMKIMLLFAIIFVFIMPGMIAFDDAEKNYFTMYLNDVEIGSTDSKDMIDEVMAQARRIIAGDSTELIYARGDLEIKEQKVLFGSIDSEKKLVEKAVDVLKENTIQTLQRAYTVKVNEYSVNLPHHIYSMLHPTTVLLLHWWQD